MFCEGSSVVGQESKSSVQELTLDSLGKSAGSKAAENSSSDFSLSMLDQAGSTSEASNLTDFTPQSWEDNLRFTVDLAYRPSFSGQTGSFGGLGFAGIDLHKVFTDKQGDWGTLILQTYLTRIDNVPAPQSGFDDDSDFELVNRITNFNFTRYGKGKTNFRIGQF